MYNVFGSKIYESESEDEKVDKIVGLNQPSGLLRRSFTKHSTSKVAYGKADGKLQVYAKTTIKSGELIEVAPLLILGEDALDIDNIQDHVFTINKKYGVYALALGYGSIYGHSDEPNAEWTIVQDKKQIRITALSDIQEGQAITISYGESYWETRRINKE